MKRKEEEKEILAQMDEAMKEEKKKEKPSAAVDNKGELHCRKCSTLMQNGKCPACGHTVYVPMDEKKQQTIRWILGGICFAAFIVVVILMQ
jgi:rubrerythrin